MSNGGFMSYYLSCRLSDRIAAIASVTGTMVVGLPETCDATHPTPVMQIHGTSDGIVPYEGSIIFESIEDVVDYWVSFNNCNPVAEFTEVPDIVTSDNCTVEHYVYSDGDAGTTVEFYKVLGGDHSWPGAIINLNVTNMDFNASKEIWRFFRQYKLNMLTSVIETYSEESDILLYPNPGNGICNASFPDASKRTIRLFDACGKLLSVNIVSSSTYTISLPVQGLFYLEVEDAKGIHSHKILYE
jgi:polyhydroxybutyrate depolymerase